MYASGQRILTGAVDQYSGVDRQRCGTSWAMRLARMRWQPREHVVEVGVRIEVVHLRRADQAQDRLGTLSGAQAAGEQPVRSADGDWADPILDPVLVEYPVTPELCSGRPLFGETRALTKSAVGRIGWSGETLGHGRLRL